MRHDIPQVVPVRDALLKFFPFTKICRIFTTVDEMIQYDIINNSFHSIIPIIQNDLTKSKKKTYIYINGRNLLLYEQAYPCQSMFKRHFLTILLTSN